RRLERRLRPGGGCRPPQWGFHALRPPLFDRRSRRPVGQERTDRGQDRLDPALDPPPPALPDAAQKRADPSAQNPSPPRKARGHALRRATPRLPPLLARCRTPSAPAPPA